MALDYMAYTEKFQKLSDIAISHVGAVTLEQLDQMLAVGAILLDIRDKEEHDAAHILGSINVSRGKLEMNIESVVPNIDATIICYCNASNRGALSAYTLKCMGYGNAKFLVGGLNEYRKRK